MSAILWYPVAQVARMLDVGERDLRRAVASGKIRRWEYGGAVTMRRYVVSWDDACAWKLRSAESSATLSA